MKRQRKIKMRNLVLVVVSIVVIGFFISKKYASFQDEERAMIIQAETASLKHSKMDSGKEPISSNAGNRENSNDLAALKKEEIKRSNLKNSAVDRTKTAENPSSLQKDSGTQSSVTKEDDNSAKSVKQEQQPAVSNQSKQPTVNQTEKNSEASDGAKKASVTSGVSTAHKKTVGESNEAIAKKNTAGKSESSTVKKKSIAKPEVPAAQKEIVYLTFDDGPSKATLSILHTLSKYDAKATFFMLEPNMKKFPGALKVMKAQGESFGLHGVSHDVHRIYQSPKTVVNEMSTAQKTLEKLTGVRTELIRTPFGSYPYMKPAYMAAVHGAGFKLWDWTIDSEDWKYTKGEYIKKTIAQLEHYPYKRNPRIILMHDKETTSAHLKELLVYLKQHGYRFGALNEHLSPYSQVH
jgi:peptidoglycan-N-acetylglucosamine deacetylase